MSTPPPINLSDLPPPEVVEELDYEAIRQAMIDDFRSRDPEFDAVLESDPAIKVLEAAAYREMLVRQRVNDAARQNMVATATGADLDNLAALLGVERQEGEGDNRFRKRVVLSWERITTAGSVGSYRYHTLSADPRVRDVRIYSSVPGTVDVVVMSREGDGTPAPDLLDAVETRLSADKVRPLTDTVIVHGATPVGYTVDATLHLQPGPDADVVRAAAVDAVQRYADQARGIGQLVAPSAITSALHQAGVRYVDLRSPTQRIEAGGAEVPVLQAVNVDVTVDG